MNRSRQLWSEENMKKALKEVFVNKMSISKASMKCNIPRRTLGDYVKKKSEIQLESADSSTAEIQFKQSKLGRGTVLTESQEKELVTRLFRLADVGFPLTPKELRKSVFLFCKESNIETPFNQDNGIAGRKWLSLFLKRHPEVRRRKAQNLNEARAAKLNRFIVNDYFSILDDVLTKMDLKSKPQNVYNLDEKGVRMCLHKSPSVLAKKGARCVHSRGKEHGENVTVVGCCAN